MNETSNASNILDQYDDKERLAIILRLHKEGHISEAESLNLLTGDRNYFLSETVQKIQETLSRSIQPIYHQPYQVTGTPWTGNQFPTYSTFTSGQGIATN
jgi:hypothetical protein